MGLSSVGAPLGASTKMRGLNVIVEGRKKPLYIKTRKENGEIIAQVIDQGEVLCSIILGKEDYPLLVVQSEKVVVVYET